LDWVTDDIAIGNYVEVQDTTLSGARLNNRTPPAGLDAGVVMERHYALMRRSRPAVPGSAAAAG